MNAIEESDVEGLIALGSGDGCLSLKDVRMVQEVGCLAV
jgi:hypothetical protein